MTLKQQRGKGQRREGGKASWAEKGTGSISPRKGRLTHVWGKAEGRPEIPRPRALLPLPHALPSDLHRPGRGRGTRMRSGALRQPPQLPEVAWTGWSRLEPVAPAREPKTHKGRRRLTARVSLRGAAVGGCWAVPLPQPLSGAGASLRP